MTSEAGALVNRFDFFVDLPRRYPGGVVFTSAYLTAISIRGGDTVLELGCGVGERAVWISRSRGARVIAVDAEPRHLARARRLAHEGGSGSLIRPVCASYKDLPFADETFKVVLAETAAVSLGLKQALTLWRRVVTKDGHLAIAYPGVVDKDAPQEVRAPLEKYTAEPLGTLEEYHATVRAAGFELIHQAALHPDLWEAYYGDNVRHAWALVASRQASDDDPIVQEVLGEAEWYRRVGRGQVFYQAMVLRRIQ